jgi:phosphatidylinositol alpha-1,6-mannosyltransferase
MILLLSFDVRRRGGIERLSLQTRTTLERQGQLVRLICPQRWGPGPLGRLCGRLRFLVQLAWWLPQAQLVLSMHALLLRPVLWLTSLRPQNQRLHCWLHGIEVWGAALEGVRPALLRCDGLIASSRFSRDQVLSQPGQWPATAVVHPMADLIDGKKQPVPLPASLTLLTVARMDSGERYKGHRLVLSALALLRHKGDLPPGLQWRIVGGGDDQAALEAETESLDLAPWVRFLGSIEDQQLRQELRHCSLLLLPSAFSIEPDGRACGEGFGIVYLEAAQAGRACIACCEGGQTDLIVDGETGWLIEPSEHTLAQLLSRLAEQPKLLASAGHAARARALSEFDQRCFASALTKSLNLQMQHL